MPLFEYVAKNESGVAERGAVEGVSLSDVADRLVARGLELESITERAQEAAQSVEPPLEPRPAFQTDWWGRVVDVVPLQALQFFFRQLSVMLEAGINPTNALETLAKSTRDAKLAGIIREARDHVASGRPMTAGLQRYPEVFTPLMISLIRVGEDTGSLPEQLKSTSEYIERDIALRNVIKRETAGPKLTVAASLIVIFLTNAIITAISPGAQKLPTPYIVWILAFVVGGAALVFVKLFLPRASVRREFDAFVLRLPGIGPMVHGFAMAKFGRAFGALYRAGVPFQRGLALAADACGNEAVRAKVVPAAQLLERGTGVTDALASTGAFDPIILDMTRTGETTGNLDQMLGKAADYFEDEGAVKAQLASKIIGVVCLLAVAAYVLFIVVSFYVGYFQNTISSGLG